jgi:2'-5' RNA ligase
MFVALDLPDPVRARVRGIRYALDPHGGLARWVDPRTMHLTLRFLGDVAPEQIDPLTRELAGVQMQPVGIGLVGVGFFPDRVRPRVFWIGARSEDLADLASRVEQAVHLAGFPGADRPFRPHITLARAPRTGFIPRALVTASETMNDRCFGSFAAARYVLYRSRPGEGGTVHENVSEFVFAGTGSAGPDAAGTDAR